MCWLRMGLIVGLGIQSMNPQQSLSGAPTNKQDTIATHLTLLKCHYDKFKLSEWCHQFPNLHVTNFLNWNISETDKDILKR